MSVENLNENQTQAAMLFYKRVTMRKTLLSKILYKIKGIFWLTVSRALEQSYCKHKAELKCSKRHKYVIIWTLFDEKQQRSHAHYFALTHTCLNVTIRSLYTSHYTRTVPEQRTL